MRRPNINTTIPPFFPFLGNSFRCCKQILFTGEMEGGVEERKAKEQRERIAKGMPGGRAVYPLSSQDLGAGDRTSSRLLPTTQSTCVTGDFLKTKQTNKPERVTGRGGKKKKKELQALWTIQRKEGGFDTCRIHTRLSSCFFMNWRIAQVMITHKRTRAGNGQKKKGRRKGQCA